MENIRESGVGMIYAQGLESVLESSSGLVQTIEIEPQTFWYKRPEDDSYHFNESTAKWLKDFQKNILFHGVGYPIGGTIPPDSIQLPTLKKHAAFMQPQWMSEHLSFNTIQNQNGAPCNTNFLLPPIQTEEGVSFAVKNIKKFKQDFNLPFAFETGVNYLQPFDWEIEDGKFVRQIAEQADCYILLDLHNLLANQKNGRQNVLDYVAQLPLERVIEIHLAGGLNYDGYYLDAHSGVSSQELLDLTIDIVRQIPSLKALIFEMLPEYALYLKPSDLKGQLESMSKIWDQRGRQLLIKKAPVTKPHTDPVCSPAEWEQALGLLAIRKNPKSEIAVSLKKDKGVEIIQNLIDKFRASQATAGLKYTTKLLILTLGKQKFMALLQHFFLESDPYLFAQDASLEFINYLKQHVDGLSIPYYEDLLYYEQCILQTLVDNKKRTIVFNYDPSVLLDFLNDFKLPETELPEQEYVIELTPDISAKEAVVYEPVIHS